MSRLPEGPALSVPGPECFCGAELRQAPLPAEIAAIFGQKAIWVHAGTGDIRCYPESSVPEDAAATAAPVDGAP